nr:mucin-5AC-like isoform X3 [Penaeus vannamei]
MKCLVVAALAVVAVGSPVPDNCLVPCGTVGQTYVALPLQYQASYAVGAGPVAPTPEVQQATAAFMAAWNAAAARANTITSTLLTPSGYVQNPAQVQTACAQFLAAWNQAATRAATVQHAVYSLPQPVQQTEEVRKATEEFMAAWRAAAQRVSTIQQAITVSADPYSSAPKPVEATEEVKRATAEFMEAWNKAAARVPSIQTTMYQLSGTTPSATPAQPAGSTPQFAPSVEQATAEFMKAWNAAAAAAAAAPDVNIIMGASSLPRTPAQAVVYQAHSVGTPSAPSSFTPAAPPVPSYGAPRPVEPTPEVQRATAEFMAAWNKAAARATKIQSVLVKSGTPGHYNIQVPQQVQATREVQKATAEFMAAWNEAARQATTVQHAMYSVPQPVQPTEEVRRATAEFMAAWEAAAQRASAIRQAVSVTADPYSAAPKQVEATEEVKRATAEFMDAWNKAAARVGAIQTTVYQVAGTVPAAGPAQLSGSAPRFTPAVEQATAEFMKVWNAAAAAAAAAPDVNIIMGASSLPRTPAQAVVYQAHSVGTPSAPSSFTPAAPPVPSYGAPRPVEPTPEVQRATAEFMAAWNKAAARATKIQSVLVKSGTPGHYNIQVPQQVQATREVQKATAEFMAAWNEAARRATTVQHAMYSVPQPVQPTEEVRRATAEFMASWEAAAQRASAIRQAVSVTADPYSAAPKQVEATEEVKRATAEFMDAWNKAAARVGAIQTTVYQVAGTVPAAGPAQLSGSAPRFTPSVEQATAEFMKAWNAAAAAAAAAPDVNIIMGASSLPRTPAQAVVYQAHSVGTPSAPSSFTPAAPPVPSYGAPRPVEPTPEVQRATAEFMAAWNKAAARATKIQSVLVKSGTPGHYNIQVPQQVQATREVQKATAEFMAAWNEAARRATTVQHAMYSVPQPVQPTEEVRRATAEFMASWEAAAQRASAIRQAVSVTADPYSAAPKQVEATEEVKRATAEFMDAWNKAAARVGAIQTTVYQVAGTVPAAGPAQLSGSAPRFTPSVEQATAEFMKAWNAAAAAAAAAPDVNIIMGAGSRPQAPSHSFTYSAPTSAVHTYGVPQPVEPTPEVQRATAEFMAAWNAAAQKATQIQSSLVKSAQAPTQVGATDAVKKATQEFMAAYNAAARRAPVVEQAVSTIPQQVQETDEVKRATAEFMNAWHAAAQRASAIKQTVSSGPQPVQATDAVQRATAAFMTAWNEAASRVPRIETTMYTLSGSSALDTCAACAAPSPVSDTPEVRAAKEQFMATFRAAEAAARRASVSRGVLPVPSVLAVHAPSHVVTYSTGAPAHSYVLSDRLFAPFQGLPLHVKDC